MHLVNVTKENFDTALQIQNNIFAKDNAYTNYEESVEGVTDNLYWILEEDSQYVGVSGIYHIAGDNDSAWLGWFGILPQYRRNGLGSEALSLFEEYAKYSGYRYVRLYTERFDNDVAKSFYKHNGYSEEYYDCHSDSGAFVELLSIFSKSLDDSEVPLWENKSINMEEQIKKQNDRQKRSH